MEEISISIVFGSVEAKIVVAVAPGDDVNELVKVIMEREQFPPVSLATIQSAVAAAFLDDCQLAEEELSDRKDYRALSSVVRSENFLWRTPTVNSGKFDSISLDLDPASFASIFRGLIMVDNLAQTLMELEREHTEAMMNIIAHRNSSTQEKEKGQQQIVNKLLLRSTFSSHEDTRKRMAETARKHRAELKTLRMAFKLEMEKLRRVQKEEFRSKVLEMASRDGAFSALTQPQLHTSSGNVFESWDSLCSDEMCSRLGLRLGANQLKNEYRLVLRVGHPLDYCLPSKFSSDPNRKLSVVRAVYSEQLLGMLMMSEPDAKRALDGQRDFLEAVTTLVEPHFPDFVYQMEKIRDDLNGEDLSSGDVFVTRHSNLHALHVAFHLVLGPPPRPATDVTKDAAPASEGRLGDEKADRAIVSKKGGGASEEMKQPKPTAGEDGGMMRVFSSVKGGMRGAFAIGESIVESTVSGVSTISSGVVALSQIESPAETELEPIFALTPMREITPEVMEGLVGALRLAANHDVAAFVIPVLLDEFDVIVPNGDLSASISSLPIMQQLHQQKQRQLRAITLSAARDRTDQTLKALRSFLVENCRQGPDTPLRLIHLIHPPVASPSDFDVLVAAAKTALRC